MGSIGEEENGEILVVREVLGYYLLSDGCFGIVELIEEPC